MDHAYRETADGDELLHWYTWCSWVHVATDNMDRITFKDGQKVGDDHITGMKEHVHRGEMAFNQVKQKSMCFTRIRQMRICKNTYSDWSVARNIHMARFKYRA